MQHRVGSFNETAWQSTIMFRVGSIESTQAWCEKTRVWLLLDRWGHVSASSVDQLPGLRVIDKPRERSYREY